MLDLIQIFAAAAPLATLDDDGHREEYRTCALVLKRAADGTISYYTPLDEWPTSDAGRLASRDALIAQLQAHIADLEKQLGSRPPPWSDPETEINEADDSESDDLTCPECGVQFERLQGLASHRFRKHGVRKGGEIAEEQHADDGPVSCAYCDRQFKNTHALGVHYARSHRLPDEDAESERLPPPSPGAKDSLQPAEEDSNWFCMGCMSNAHTRSLHDPNHCIRCAAQPHARAA